MDSTFKPLIAKVINIYQFRKYCYFKSLKRDTTETLKLAWFKTFITTIKLFKFETKTSLVFIANCGNP